MAQKNTDILSLSPVLSDSRTALRQLRKDIAILEDTLNKSGGLRLDVTLNEQQLQQQIKNAAAQITTAFQNTVSSKNLSGRYSISAPVITRSDSGVSASLQKMFSEQQISISNLVRQQERLLSISSALTSAENQRLALLREQNNLLSAQNSNSISNNSYTAKAKSNSLPSAPNIESLSASPTSSGVIKTMNEFSQTLDFASLVTSAIPQTKVLSAILGMVGSNIDDESKKYEEYEKSLQLAIENSSALKDSYNQITANIKAGMSTLTDIQEEYQKFSKGVDQYGENIELSASDYKRYREIVQYLAQLVPELIIGIDKDNYPIIKNDDVINKALEILQQKQIDNTTKVTSGSFAETIADGYSAEAKQLGTHFLSRVMDSFRNSNPLDWFSDKWAEGSSLRPEIIYKDMLQEKEEITKAYRSEYQKFAYASENYQNLTPQQKEFITSYVNHLNPFNDFGFSQNKYTLAKEGRQITELVDKLGSNSEVSNKLNILLDLETSSVNLKEQIKTLADNLNIDPISIEIALGLEEEPENGIFAQLNKTRENIIKFFINNNPFVSKNSYELAKILQNDFRALLPLMEQAYKEHTENNGIVSAKTYNGIIEQNDQLSSMFDKDELGNYYFQTEGLEALIIALNNSTISGYKNLESLKQQNKELYNSAFNIELIKSSLYGFLTTFSGASPALAAILSQGAGTIIQIIKSKKSPNSSNNPNLGIPLNSEISNNIVSYSSSSNPEDDKSTDDIGTNDTKVFSSKLPISGSGGAASSSVDVYKEAFDKEYKALKHNLDMELITNQTYYDELNSLNQKYFANRKKYLDEYRQYELELYELQKTLSRNRIDDIQHEIDMLARQDTFGGTSQTAFAQIEKYAAIQNEIHAQAERARSHGVDANNDYLQELQTQWWEYADKINEVYQKILDDADRNTAHQAELIERNEWDADGKERIAMYISMQEQIAREAERYRNMGYQDTSEEIQNLQKQWWGYRDSMLEVYDDIYEKYKDTVEKRLNISSGIVDKESSKLSYLKSQFDKATTTEAQKVYANDIYNSANDQLWEAKQAQIRNTENVNQERERFAQLLSETGIQYSGTFDDLFNIDGSVNNGAAESVRQMIQSIGNPDAYTKLFESILDAGSQGKTKWKETSDEIDNTLSLLQSLQDSYIDKQQKAFDLVVDMLKDRYDKEREFAEKMHEEELDRLDERRKIIEDTYNRQISLLDDLKTEEDYNLALGKEQDAETDLIREIEKYSMIDTQAARTKVSELQKQLQEQQDKIAQMQRDKEYSDKKKALEEDRDLLLDNLDEKVEAENESYDELLKRLEDYYDEKNLYQQAQAALESGYINLFKEESIKSYDDVGKYGADTALKLTDAFKEYYTATGTMADQIALNENARILNSYKDICVQVDTLTKKLDKLRQQGFGADGLKGNTFDAYEEKINRLKTDGAYATQEILRTQNKITALEASGDDTSEQYAYLKLVAGMEKTRTLEVIKQRKAAENPKDRDITEQVDYLRFIVGILGEPMPKYHTGRMAAWLNTEEEHAILKTDETVLTRPVTEGLLSKLRKIDLLDGIFHTAALPFPAVVGNPAHSFAGIGDVNITINADGTPDKRMLKSFGNDILSRLKVEIEKVR